MGNFVTEVLVLVAIVLVLPHCSSAPPSLLPPALIPSTAGPAPVTVHCYVVDGTVIMIPSTVSNQTRQDVLYSLLVAQLAADKKYSRSSANEDWIKFLDNTLDNIAWVTAKHSYGDLTVKSSKFNISGLALQEMGKDSVMKAHMKTYGKIMSTLGKLPTSSPARKMIQNRTYNSTKHDAAVMFCSVEHTSSSTGLSVLMIALSGVKDTTSYTLTHNYTTKEVKSVKELVGHYVLNEHSYPTIRQKIIDKLGSRVKTGIVEVKLS